MTCMRTAMLLTSFAFSLALSLTQIRPHYVLAAQGVSTLAPCSDTDVLKVLSVRSGFVVKSDTLNMLRNRIAACRGKLTKPQDKSKCITAGSLYSALDYYNVLEWCINALSAEATPTPSPSPSPFVGLGPAGSVIVTIGIHPDAPTAARMALALNEAVRKNANLNAKYHVLSAPGWDLSTFALKCQQDPSIAGAFIVLPSTLDSGIDNYVFYSRSWTMASLQGVTANCQGNEAPVTAVVDWSSDVVRDAAGRISVPLGPLSALASAIQSLFPQHQSTTTATYAVATPNPLPTRTQVLSGITVEDQTTHNSANAAIVGGEALLTGLNSYSVGSLTSTDAQTRDAMARSMRTVVKAWGESCDSAKKPQNDAAKSCLWRSR